MNWEAIGAVGEVAGAIGVIVTVAYLAVQIRQNSRSVRAAAFQSGVDGINQLNNLIAHDESLARIFRIGNESLEKLTDDEQVRFGFMYLSCFRVFETMYFHRLQGAGTELWSTTKEHIASLLASPGAREWWSKNTFGFTSEFRTYVEEHLDSRQP